MILSRIGDEPELAEARRFLAEIASRPELAALPLVYPSRPLAPLVGEPRLAAEFERCGGCGSGRVVVVAVARASGGQPADYREHEVRCRDCGRYTARCELADR